MPEVTRSSDQAIILMLISRLVQVARERCVTMNLPFGIAPMRKLVDFVDCVRRIKVDEAHPTTGDRIKPTNTGNWMGLAVS